MCQELLDSREQMSPFIDGDYDTYVAEMADVQTWGGEPELALAAEVLQLPITVYQREQVEPCPDVLRYHKPPFRLSPDCNPLSLRTSCCLRTASHDRSIIASLFEVRAT